LNIPKGATILAPSAIAAVGELYTDTEGMKPNAMPVAMTIAQVRSTIAEYAKAAQRALDAGFDGVELHGANGYLVEQFLRPSSNVRADQYGGTIENRARFALEIVDAMIATIGRARIGIRLSPHGVFNDMPNYPEMDADYQYLAEQLNLKGIAYVHLVDHSAMGAPVVPDSIKKVFRQTFSGRLILSGGYDAARAEEDLVSGRCDLIAFGRPFIANPDLVVRLQAKAALNTPNDATFYTPGATGYTDYPALV
jgi:N-ethylmaleimide reductase